MSGASRRVPPGWKLLAQVPGVHEAALIEGRLAEAGIECEVESTLFTQEPVALGLLGMVKVWVPEQRFAEAESLLHEVELPEGAEPPPAEPVDPDDGQV